MQKEYFGMDSIENLKNILSDHKPKNIFLVTGKSSYERSGAKKAIETLLVNNQNCFFHFDDLEVNPKLRDIEDGISIYRMEECDFILAVGGGSVMDVAKSINILAANEAEPLDYINKKESIKNRGNILVAIPTTSGSGAESTKFSVVYVDKTKYSLEHPDMLPNYAIVDPQFTMNLPGRITASTGMDALSQAIESYWCVNSTDESKAYAREAIKLVMGNLSRAVNDPDEESRVAMSKAAHLAGKAINISKTTASHAVSYPITSYFKVPHGHAVALTLGQMLMYNSEVTEQDSLDNRGVDYVKTNIHEIIGLLGAVNVEEASGKIAGLMREIGLKTRLSDLGINSMEDEEVIIKNGFNPDRVKNNPRRLTETSLREILENIR
jgi:alcohol dehydrogenase